MLLTVKESPKAAMTLMSAALTFSTAMQTHRLALRNNMKEWSREKRILAQNVGPKQVSTFSNFRSIVFVRKFPFLYSAQFSECNLMYTIHSNISYLFIYFYSIYFYQIFFTSILVYCTFFFYHTVYVYEYVTNTIWILDSLYRYVIQVKLQTAKD